MMLPGIVSGSGRRTFMLGSIPLLATAGARPSAVLSDTALNVLTIVPNGEPPSTMCICPVSSSTCISANCISSFGIDSTFLNSIGCCAANCG